MRMKMIKIRFKRRIKLRSKHNNNNNNNPFLKKRPRVMKNLKKDALFVMLLQNIYARDVKNHIIAIENVKELIGKFINQFAKKKKT